MTTNRYCRKTFCLFSFLKNTIDWFGLSQWLSGKESTCKEGDTRDMGLISGLGRSLGGGHGNPLQYSYLENPMDRGGYSSWGCKDSNTTEAIDDTYWFGCIRSQLWCAKLSCLTECGILVSLPEIEPISLEGDCLSTGPPRKYHCVFSTKTSNIYFRSK